MTPNNSAAKVDIDVDEVAEMWVFVEELNFNDEKCTQGKMSAVIGEPPEFSRGVE